ncbi:MAG: RNA methyltransferase [Chitinophagales bacterium]
MKFEKITKSNVKHLRFLHSKKYRQKYNQFIVEGYKSVREFINSAYKCVALFGKEDALAEFYSHDFEKYICNTKELQQISTLKNPQDIVGVFEIPVLKPIDYRQDFIVALDDMRDPGNLGTVIRTADWFGLNQILCSETCVDAFNPKVVQASMGSLSRINVVYTNLVNELKAIQSHTLVFADMEGKAYQNFNWNKNILVIGNEANGISADLKKMKHELIAIPQKGKAESLNVAVSAAIIMSRVLG